LRGKTEQIRNQLNPDFKNVISMTYFFEKEQQIKFKIIDGDADGDTDTIGEV